MFRACGLIGAFALVLSGCGGDSTPVFSTVADGAATSTSAVTSAVISTTTSSSVAPTSSPSSTAATTTTQPVPSLGLLDILLRYDGDDGSGTFQAVVCNRSIEATDGSVSITVAGSTVGPLFVDALLPDTCTGLSDPTATFESLGVSTGSVVVGVAVDSNVTHFEERTVQVDELSVLPPADELAAYQSCVAQDGDACVGWVRAAPVPGEVMTRLGWVSVIAPERFEPLATFSIFDNLNCYEDIEGFLGVDGPDVLVQQWNESDWYLAAAADGVWHRDMPTEALEREVVEALPGRWPLALAGLCDATTAHEQTHLVIGRAPVPGFVNEGLSVWMEDPGHSNSAKEPRLSCDETGWIIESPNSDPYREDFVDIAAFGPGDPTLPFYYTGFCFWQYLEDEHGLETIREILAEATNLRDPRYEYCNPWDGRVAFVRDIVSPIVGYDFSTISDRWGVPADYDGCEGA